MNDQDDREKQLSITSRKIRLKATIIVVLVVSAVVFLSNSYPMNLDLFMLLFFMGFYMTTIWIFPETVQSIKLNEKQSEQSKELYIELYKLIRKMSFFAGILGPLAFFLRTTYPDPTNIIVIVFLCIGFLIFSILFLPMMSLPIAYLFIGLGNLPGKHSSFAYYAAIKLCDYALKGELAEAFKLKTQAQCYLKLNQFEKAEQLLTASIELVPTLPDYYMERGAARHQFRKLDAAEEDFSKAIELNPDSSNAYYSRAMVRKDKTEKNSLNNALEDINKAIELTPAYYPYLPPEIINIAKQKQINLEPINCNAYFMRASIYNSMNRLDDCLVDIGRCLNSTTSFHYAKCLKAQVLLTQNKVDEAEEVLNEVGKTYKFAEWKLKLWILSARSDMYLEKNDFLSALEDANEMLKISTENGCFSWTLGWTQRAESLYHMNRGREALSDVEKSIQLDPNGAYAYKIRARIKMSAGQFREANEDLDLAEQKNPFGSVNGLRSDFLRKMAKYEEALREAEEGRESRPQSSFCHAMHALALLELNRAGEAVESAQKATELNGYKADALIALGRAYVASGDITTGESYLNKAIELNPYLADAYEYRANVLEKLKKTESAETDRKKCQQLRDDFMK